MLPLRAAAYESELTAVASFGGLNATIFLRMWRPADASVALSAYALHPIADVASSCITLSLPRYQRACVTLLPDGFDATLLAPGFTAADADVATIIAATDAPDGVWVVDASPGVTTVHVTSNHARASDAVIVSAAV